MANRVFNNVTVRAPLDVVKAWLVPSKNEPDQYYFDIERIFPEIGEIDPDEREYLDLTGCSREPVIHYCDGDERTTSLGYDTARSPNNRTLQRLHELTGWEIESEYEEPGDNFEGILRCVGGVCHDEEREYQPYCDVCNIKHPQSEYEESTDDDFERVCKLCCAKEKKKSR